MSNADISVIEIEHEGRSFVVAARSAIVGRASDAAVRVIHPLVSRHHCRIDLTADGAMIEDLSSANGTNVNGRAVDGAYKLVHGDVITLGKDGARLRVARAELAGRDLLTPSREDRTEAVDDADDVAQLDEATIVADDSSIADLSVIVPMSDMYSIVAPLDDGPPPPPRAKAPPPAKPKSTAEIATTPISPRAQRDAMRAIVPDVTVEVTPADSVPQRAIAALEPPSGQPVTKRSSTRIVLGVVLGFLVFSALAVFLDLATRMGGGK